MYSDSDPQRAAGIQNPLGAMYIIRVEERLRRRGWVVDLHVYSAWSSARSLHRSCLLNVNLKVFPTVGISCDSFNYGTMLELESDNVTVNFKSLFFQFMTDEGRFVCNKDIRLWTCK